MAQAFRRLGSEVTVVDVAPRILPREDADLAAVVANALEAEGVQFRLGASIVSCTGHAHDVRLRIHGPAGANAEITGSHLLLAAGRTANVEGLGLDAAGVDVHKGRIVTEAGLRTTNSRVHVIGDAAGGHQFTHLAEHHAGVVLRHAIFRMSWVKPSSVVPWCTFTDPELARVGLSEARPPVEASRIVSTAFPSPTSIVRAPRTRPKGWRKSSRIPKANSLGAAIVGAHAGELIAEYGLAIAKGMNAKDMTGVIHAYPTLAQINRRVADQRLKEGLTPNARLWIQRIFGLKGARG
jgi:pyruvate/2-oxoglutarate dehydrogenase complex dihydrolipoamide dehydrogenase (E3) component